MSSNPHIAPLIKLIQRTAGRYHVHDVFRDFCEMAAISVSNVVDQHQREAREARYMAIVGKYQREEVAQFPRMLGLLTAALEFAPSDVLGSVYMQLDLGNKNAGQFFTPYEISRLMAGLTTTSNDIEEKIRLHGFVRMNEPTSGAGGMCIAFAENMREAGINYQQHLHVTAQDIDIAAVHMTYLQLSLLHIPAIVIHGDTLAMTERSSWFTPAHILGGWSPRIARQIRNEASDPVAIVPLPQSLPTPAPSPQPVTRLATEEQLSLF